MLSMFVLSRNKKLIDVNQRGVFRCIDRAIGIRGANEDRIENNENLDGKQEGISDSLGVITVGDI